MATTADIKNGAVIMHKNKRMKVVKFQHVKPGKGGAFVRTKLRDILTGKIIDETFNAGHKLEFIRVEARSMQYLYEENSSYVFMHNDTYEQMFISEEVISGQKHFLLSGMAVDVLFDGEEVLDIRLPSHVVVEVTETEPGFRGNTATGATKPATVETGFDLNVPLFIDIGDKVKIDTRNGEYVERSKE
ncbi:uncharacterized protein METZ01_LOCUS221029 [marine metagenome]|uniref:Translation elongation factor P/YeiP central domain-containing protein n=1 Tax=marine metagenome TaxID=408172 RepID=A0A382G058_9ZZZZ